MTPIYENYRSETPVYFHYATGSKNYENSLFGLKLLATFSREASPHLIPPSYGPVTTMARCLSVKNLLPSHTETKLNRTRQMFLINSSCLLLCA